jgi:hypothetical protein
MMSRKEITVLIPTFNRVKALAVTMTSLYFRVIHESEVKNNSEINTAVLPLIA